MVPRTDDEGQPIKPTHRRSLEAEAAKASFEEDHSLGRRRWDASRHGSEPDSIPHSYSGTGRNWVDSVCPPLAEALVRANLALEESGGEAVAA